MAASHILVLEKNQVPLDSCNYCKVSIYCNLSFILKTSTCIDKELSIIGKVDCL